MVGASEDAEVAAQGSGASGGLGEDGGPRFLAIRRRRVRWGAAVVALGLVVGGAWWYYGAHRVDFLSTSEYRVEVDLSCPRMVQMKIWPWDWPEEVRPEGEAGGEYQLSAEGGQRKTFVLRAVSSPRARISVSVFPPLGDRTSPPPRCPGMAIRVFADGALRKELTAGAARSLKLRMNAGLAPAGPLTPVSHPSDVEVLL